MKLDDLTSVGQLEDLLSGTQAVASALISDKNAGYRWIQGELVRFDYLACPHQHKGVLIRYPMKVSGYSRQQMMRLVGQYRANGRLQRQQPP